MITLPAKTLRDALSVLQRATPRRDTTSVLSNCLISRLANSCTLEATDNETSAQASFHQSPASTSYSFLMPLDKLSQMARSSDEDFTFSLTSQHHIEVRSGNAKFTYNSQSTDSFLRFVGTEESLPTFSLPLSRFASMISHCHFPDEAGRYRLGGLQLVLDSSSLRGVGYNSGGSCMATEQLTVESAHSCEVVIPTKMISVLLSLDYAPSDIVQCWFLASTAFFCWENWKFATALLQAPPPYYQKLLLLSLKESLDFPVSLLKQLFTRASILCDEEKHTVQLSHRDGKLAILGNRAGFGEASDWIATEFDIAPFCVYVDPRTMLQICSRFSGDEMLRIGLLRYQEGGFVPKTESFLVESGDSFRCAVALMKPYANSEEVA